MCETPRNRAGILLRLGDSARKIEAIEKRQTEQMESRILAQNQELDRLTKAVDKAATEKRAQIKKLVQIHKNSEFCTIDDHMSSMIERIAQAAADSGVLQAELLDLENELREGAQCVDDSEEEDFSETRNTMKALKDQVRGVEEYVRNGVRFEKDETKGKIKRLERTLSQLRDQLRSVNRESNDLRDMQDESLTAIHALCADMEGQFQRKCELISELKRENNERLRRLELKTRENADIQLQVQDCHTQVLNDYQL